MDGRRNRRVRQPGLRGRLSQPLFPSDLDGARRASKARLYVAGRVVSIEGDRLYFGDAFALALARGAGFAELRPGDWVVISGTWDGRALGDARVERRQSAPVPRGDGEFARLAFDAVGPRLRARSRALAAIRAYFEGERFVEVETPLRVPAPGVDAHVRALRAEAGFLITSPELEMKRLLTGGVPRQFQIARVGRQDESGALHEPEFTLLEWYRAFASPEAVMRDTEQVVRRVARAVRGKLELVTPEGKKLALAGRFERESVADAFRRHAGIRDVVDLAASDEARYFELLVDRVEPALARRARPVFLLDYPLSQAALARPCPDKPGFAERFELYAGGIELSNGYGELTDPAEQRARFQAERRRRRRAGEPIYPINERFLGALEEGMPAASGNALGVDRLILLCTGAGRIQDTIAFPRERL